MFESVINKLAADDAAAASALGTSPPDPDDFDDRLDWFRARAEWAATPAGKAHYAAQVAHREAEERTQRDQELAYRRGLWRQEAERFAERHGGCTFATFRTDSKEQLRVRTAVENWTQCILGTRPWRNDRVTRLLVLRGPVGVGKTHLAVASAHELVAQRGSSVAVYPVADFLREANPYAHGDADRGRSARLLRECSTVDVLVLDDIGTKTAGLTRAQLEYVYTVANNRLAARLVTIMTSNLGSPLETLIGASDAVDRQEVERITSRWSAEGLALTVGGTWKNGEWTRTMGDHRKAHGRTS